MSSFFIYAFIMFSVTYVIRAVPFALINKKIENRYVKSFLFYIPYTVLAAMTFPAVLYSTDSVVSSLGGLITAVICSIRGKSLTIVAAVSCVTVFILELIII